MIDTRFFGNPRLYRTISWAIGLYTTIGIYVVVAGVKYFFHQDSYLLTWSPIAATLVIAFLFSRFIFFMMMYIDGQFYRKKRREQNMRTNDLKANSST